VDTAVKVSRFDSWVVLIEAPFLFRIDLRPLYKLCLSFYYFISLSE
jgi:hypothetical protein